MTSDSRAGHFEILDGFPRDVVAIEAKGHIDHEDYEKTLIPTIESRLREEGKIKLFYVAGEDFEGFSVGAAWDDAKLGLTHIGDFVRIAVVSDKEWIRVGTRLFMPFLAGEVRVFGLDQRDAARAWISANQPETDPGPGVAADYAIPPLEDKTPPVG